jgi:competence protein ComEC
VRKLALTACFFTAAVCASQYLIGGVWQLVSAGISALLLIAAALKKDGRVCAAGVGLCAGFVWSFVWDALFLADARELASRTEDTKVEAFVLENAEETRNGARMEVRTEYGRCMAYFRGAEPNSLPPPGETVSFTARFRMAEKNDYLMSLGIPLTADVRGDAEPTGKRGRITDTLPLSIRRVLSEALSELYPDGSGPFMTALLTGDRTALEEDGYDYSMMKRSGIAHCVAVSGMHLSILTGLVFFLLGRRRGAAAACVPVIVLFMAVTGFRMSVVRAGVMQLMLCLAAMTRKEYDSRTALMLALMLITAANPHSIKNTGLQLSFASTLGIILFYNRFNVIKVKYIGPTLAVTAGAMVFTTPLTVLYFGSISVVAPITNLLTMWAVTLCFSLGMLSAALFFVFAPLARPAAFIVRLGALYIRSAAELTGRLPFASVSGGSVYVKIWLALVYLVLLWLLSDRGRRHKAMIFASVFVAGAAAAIALEWHSANSAELRFAALDVGQGQCVVLSSKGYVVMVDCGGSLKENAGDAAADYLDSMGKRQVDCLVLTHMHSDHINGVAELMRRKKVKKIYACEENRETVGAAAENGTPIFYVLTSDEEFDGGAARFRVMRPAGTTEDNEWGLTVLCSAGDTDVLVTGDIGRETELLLMEKEELPDAEILVAGHHGSAGSTSRELLEAVRPEIVVISAGRNYYGHPADKTLERIERAGATCLRTDEEGDVILTYGRRRR